jgi:exopolyphosphatase/pppGpp-phosphohydrolase
MRIGVLDVGSNSAHLEVVDLWPGAIVAEALMTTFDLDLAEVCPWALREGITSRRARVLPTLTVADEPGHLVQRSFGPRRLTPTDAS